MQKGQKDVKCNCRSFSICFYFFFFQKKYLKLCFYSMFQEQKSKCALQYKIRHRIYLCQNGINRLKKKKKCKPTQMSFKLIFKDVVHKWVLAPQPQNLLLTLMWSKAPPTTADQLRDLVVTCRYIGSGIQQSKNNSQNL